MKLGKNGIEQVIEMKLADDELLHSENREKQLNP
jgi:hypothetical protein